ncbi:MAG: hypothetical protein IPK35_07485 [Saprospiraceae bacterium]|nr:hypothetical protein [Saprospiraceae bacterium]
MYRSGSSSIRCGVLSKSSTHFSALIRQFSKSKHM